MNQYVVSVATKLSVTLVYERVEVTITRAMPKVQQFEERAPGSDVVMNQQGDRTFS